MDMNSEKREPERANDANESKIDVNRDTCFIGAQRERAEKKSSNSIRQLSNRL